ncbi:hypothetical protein QFC19_002687 [Naganishia cerealis]|uniref:Uncharacterized protein n=1 Tax=Naganishia cerealis TaxID=610337 RepID=A0ACC2W9Q0_9TREE|nr:hypothetical protein QFC19_002687 [Naganishia cerealis]
MLIEEARAEQVDPGTSTTGMEIETDRGTVESETMLMDLAVGKGISIVIKAPLVALVALVGDPVMEGTEMIREIGTTETMEGLVLMTGEDDPILDHDHPFLMAFPDGIDEIPDHLFVDREAVRLAVQEVEADH